MAFLLRLWSKTELFEKVTRREHARCSCTSCSLHVSSCPMFDLWWFSLLVVTTALMFEIESTLESVSVPIFIPFFTWITVIPFLYSAGNIPEIWSYLLADVISTIVLRLILNRKALFSYSTFICSPNTCWWTSSPAAYSLKSLRSFEVI